MSIIRVEKNEDYSVMNNTGLKDKKLSWGAKGLLAYLLSLPDDWEIIVEHLKTISTDGRDSTNSKIKELINQGYIVKNKQEKKKISGKYKGCDYTVYEKPLRIFRNGNTVTDLPLRQSRYGRAVTVNPRLVSTKRLNTKELSTKEDIPSSNEDGVSSSKKDLNRNVKELLKEVMLVGDFNNKFPKNGGIPTKTIMEIQKFILSLKAGRLFRDYKFDQNWKIKNHIKLKVLNDGVMDWDKILSLLKKGTKRYSKLRQQGYWPEDKKNLTRNMLDWLYNPRTEKSWFLFCLFNRPKTINKVTGERVATTIPEEYRERAAKMKGVNWDDLLFWKKVKDLYDWYEKYEEGLGAYNMGRWYSQCRNFGRFLECISEFSKEWDDWCLGNFGYGNKTWYKFGEWMKKNYEIDINPGEQRLKTAIKFYNK